MTDEKPEVGYTIPRTLVGEWIIEEIVRMGGDKWVGEGVTITA